MSYQVPMSEVAVTVAITGAEPEEHFVYLHPYSEYRDGPETMADYLNSPRRFFPMVLGGAPRMINRDQIQPPPLSVMSVSHQYISGLARLEDRLLIILDIDRLFDEQGLAAAP